MDLKQLNTFVTISTLQSFTKAAEALNYAQSSVTTQIKLLEEELSVKLFERIGKNISLTYQGKKLLPYAKQMLKLSMDIKTLVCDEDVPKGSLTIGVAESLCVLRLPALLGEYHKLYPEVDISLKYGSCADFRHFLGNNTIDVAFSLGCKLDDHDFIAALEMSEPMMILAYPGHPLIQKESVLPEDLAEEALILTELGCSYRATFERILSEAYVIPHIAFECGSIHTIKQFTQNRLGICLLPAIAVQEEVQKGQLVPLKWAGPDFGIVSQVLYHKDKWLSPALMAFIELARRM